jgi:hypothetical protein
MYQTIVVLQASKGAPQVSVGVEIRCRLGRSDRVGLSQ